MFLLLLTIVTSFHSSSVDCQELGSTLTAGQGSQVWITSPNATFSAGFSKNGPDVVYNFGIWYTKVEPRTLVWQAMNNDTGGVPVNLKLGDQLVFQVDGRLVLSTNDIGIVWGTYTSTVDVNRAALGEEGNLVLLSSNGQTIWASFDHPTDTLLPLQQMIGSTRLVSANRRYFAAMDRSRIALFYQGYWLEPYWSIQNTNIDQSMVNFQPRLNLTSTGVLSFFDGNGTSWKSPTKVYETAQRYALDFPSLLTRRLTLNDDGNLRMYTLTSSGSWSITWQALLLECNIFGRCGRFGVCVYRPKATCVCPPGFHPTNVSDSSQDCDYNTPLPICPAGSNFTTPNSTKVVRLTRTDFKFNDYNSQPLPQPTSEQDCIDTCLNECRCLGAAFQYLGSGICWLKGLDPAGLFNGKQGIDVMNVFFVKVSSQDPVQSPDENEFVTDANATIVPGFLWRLTQPAFFDNPTQVGLATVVILQFMLLFGVVWGGCYAWLKIIARKNGFDDGGTVQYTYQQLQTYTANFSEQLGSGGFGSVYKGVLPDGTEVAVKEINITMAKEAENQFQAEVRTIGKVHHINLVRLLGYCYEDSHKLLVYEFMPNGSLEKLIFSENSDHLRSWQSRVDIAQGIARGITYLHDECHERILHCDIKPQNILLDAQFCPKVSDFGLAKLVNRDRSLIVTTIRGTRGYLAPEWIDNMPITTKVDVYSFGMVLLEILSGRDKFLLTSSALNSVTNRWSLPDWAYLKYQGHDLNSISDKKIDGDVDWLEFNRLLRIAFWCIQYDPNARPLMSKVVQMLEDMIQVPNPPFPKSPLESQAIDVSSGSYD